MKNKGQAIHGHTIVMHKLEHSFTFTINVSYK